MLESGAGIHLPANSTLDLEEFFHRSDKALLGVARENILAASEESLDLRVLFRHPLDYDTRPEACEITRDLRKRDVVAYRQMVHQRQRR